MLRVLYDGWPLLRVPNSPQAVHLMEILAIIPDDVQPVLALPGSPPAGLPERVEVVQRNSGTGAGARLQWEQRLLPRIAAEARADLAHLVGISAPLLGIPNTLCSPVAADLPVANGVWSRLRASLARGGLVRAAGVVWPEDLPPYQGPPRAWLVPAGVHPDFVPKTHFFPPELAGFELPGSFVLYHGPSREKNIRQALQAWTWAAGPVGEVYPLLFLGISPAMKELVGSLQKAYDLRDTVIVLPEVSFEEIPLIYQAASAVFHPAAASPWGGALRYALACGKPIVALETPLTGAIVGPAGYLVGDEDPRGLGAALISVIVKDSTRKQLQDAAEARQQSWLRDGLGMAVLGVYKEILAG